MRKKIKGDWFLVIHRLRAFGIPFSKEDLQEMSGSNNYTEVDNLRAELNINIEEILPFAFDDDETFNDNVKHYITGTNVKEFAIRYNLMSKACEYADEEIILLLLEHGIALTLDDTLDDIMRFYEME